MPSVRNDLVTAIPLKSSRAFHSNITHIACATEILELAMWYDLFFKLEKCTCHAP